MENKELKLEILDTKKLPIALSSLIESSNRELQEKQQQLVNTINQAASEIMNLMSLKSEEGWKLYLNNMQFVRLGIKQDNAS